MELRKKIGRMTALWALTIIAVLVLGGLYQVFAEHDYPTEVVKAPQDALYHNAWNTTVISQDTNTSAYVSQHYSYHDLYCSVDISDTQTISITVQSSPLGTTYYNVYTLINNATSDTNVFTRVMSYGTRERLAIGVQSAGTEVTPVCRSVFFNNWTPAYYVEPKDN